MKMVLIQHLFGIPSLRQMYQRIHDTLSYRWFLGYGLLDEIPHFATVSHDPSAIFIDGTHVKASANKKKFQKEQVKKAAKIYSGQRRREVNAEREKLGKKSIEDEEDDDNNDTPQGGSGETAKKQSLPPIRPAECL